MSPSFGDATFAISTASAGADPREAGAYRHAPGLEQRGQLGGGVERRIVDCDLARIPGAPAVVDGQRADRPDVAVGAVAVLPRGEVALRVVAGVVGDHAAGDLAYPLGDDGVGERLQRGGHVTAGLLLGLDERRVVGGGQHRVARPDQPEAVDAASSGRRRRDRGSGR